MEIAIEVDAAWLARPDIVAKLMPSKRWQLAKLDVRPAMFASVRFLEVCGRLRLSFPMMSELPIFSGIRISFVDAPEVRCPPPFWLSFSCCFGTRLSFVDAPEVSRPPPFWFFVSRRFHGCFHDWNHVLQHTAAALGSACRSLQRNDMITKHQFPHLI